MISSTDFAVRTAAADWVLSLADEDGEVAWSDLTRGFLFRGERIHVLSQQGIFKPAAMELPLSIRTSVKGPYADSFASDGLLQYKYRGTDRGHRENQGLRECMRRRIPLLYFYGLAPGRYLVEWPVFVEHDDPEDLTFTVSVDVRESVGSWVGADEVRDSAAIDRTELRRRYVTASVRRRIHQASFRERVLTAYRSRCALCRLRHRELLEAAHIVPDSEEGEPEVRNGISLCAIHHRAFDRHFLGIRPDYIVAVRQEVLDEKDGPMLLHALQGVHGERIDLPTKQELRPDVDYLERRWKRFRAAS